MLKLNIGHAWNQWKSEGLPLPDDVAVKVVIYRGVSPAEVQKQFPTRRGQSDYRYLEYDRAVAYLNSEIKEVEGYLPSDDDVDLTPLWSELIRTMEDTRTRIIETLGT
jgi:hypothetical protein